MANAITLKEAISVIDSGAEFNLETVTIDGEWLIFPLSIKHNFISKGSTINSELAPLKWRKDPKHYENSSRNIRMVNNSEIRKIKIRCIRKLNGKTIL